MLTYNDDVRVLSSYTPTYLLFTTSVNMNAESRRSYRRFSQEQWRQHGYLDSPGLGPGTLTNKVHPVLSFEDQDCGGDSKWEWDPQAGQTEERLKWLLLPVLRLASALLMTPASVNYPYAILYSQREPLEKPAGQSSKRMKRVHAVQGLDREYARAKVDQALRRLAASIIISFDHPSTDSSFPPLAHGVTSQIP